MIRILFNYNCNLCCSYCFEKHFWTKKEKITPEELETILKFAGPKEEISIVGGEPTTHPQFKELLAVLRKYPNEKFLLTNALFHPDLQQDIAETFKLMMVNLNDPRTYTNENWDIVQNNIQALAHKDSPCLVQLGVNIFANDQRFEYLIPFMKFYDIIKELRIALVNPNYCFTNKYLDLKQMKEVVPNLLNLVAMAALNNFEVSLDCPIPPCLFSNEQLQFLSQHASDVRFGGCAGGFTLLPGLKIGHCFGSFPDIYDLKDFPNVLSIKQKNLEKEEKIMYDVCSFDECQNCFFRNNSTCQGGCLAFKMEK